MKRKDNIYGKYQKLVRDKDTSVTAFIENTLAKTQSMFEYDGLPPTIPQTELERILQTKGSCVIAPYNNELYAFSGAFGGVTDVYNRPTKYIVSVPYLQYNATLDIDRDCVLCSNDTNNNSLLDIIGKYAVLYCDSLISLNTASILTRITMLISASDEKTKQSADEFLRKINNGDFSIIGENAFFKGVTLQSAPTSNAPYITQLIELIQYYRATMYNEIGLQANYNMKRERLNTSEVGMNVDALLPYVDNMLKCRQNAVEQVNEKYGTNISVSLSSSWGVERENIETLTEVLNATEELSETAETSETTETTETDETAEPVNETEEITEKEKENEI